MLNIVRKPLALRDTKDIWLYSCGKWGEKQADSYLNKLNNALNRLAANPALGKKAIFIRKDVRLYHTEHHIVLYYYSNTTLTIARVLHEKMDLARHKLQ
ncbi:MAG: type II toxin-antitoxin system RelE/ParE family toxin [Psychrosphaera sp.]|nr:type II toxin-antitoxin system RelE/ParE family toxin [Psychrosphaera sp.]